MVRGFVAGAAVAASLTFFGHSASAQETEQATMQTEQSKEIEQYKQRTQVLEKKVEELQRQTRDNVVASEDQIEKVATRLAKQRKKPTDFNTYWKDGLFFETDDKAFKLHIGGRMHYDAAWIDEDADTRDYVVNGRPIGDQLDRAELRRLRFQMDGTIYEKTFYKLEVDFAGGSVALKDAFIGVKDLVPYATLQAGHFKEPFSLEELTSDNYTTFVERGLPNAFAPSYNAGVQLSNVVLDERITWAVGAFRQTDDTGVGRSEGGYNLTGRVTGLPWYEDDGKQLVHLGLAGSYRDPEPSVSYSSRPEMHLASTYLNTGSITADSAYLVGGEAAGVYGPFHAQSEVMQSFVDPKGATARSFWGGYAQIGYFLTGETRPYSKSTGTFGRVHPNLNFGQIKDGERGWGAWEVAARYSYIDLNGNMTRGGKLGDVTLGLNWYLNPNIRFMLDGVHAMLADNGAQEGGSTNEVGLRIAVDF